MTQNMTKVTQWYMYVVECNDGSLYAGATTDLTRRVYQHNFTKKGAKYTRTRRPVKLVYWKPHTDRSSALRAEAGFKKNSRKKKMEIVFGQELGVEQLDGTVGGMPRETVERWCCETINDVMWSPTRQLTNDPIDW